MSDSTTKAQIDCQHQNFRANVAVHRLEDTGCFYADIMVACAECGLPFHFITPDFGLRRDRPAASPDATELRCPIGPGAAMLPEGKPFVFEMPSKRRVES